MVSIDKVDLIHKFVQTYNAAQDSIEENRVEEAKQRYRDLMGVYHQITNSDIEPVHKELAYDQVLKVFKGVKGMKVRSRINAKSVALATVIIIISIVIFIKPEIVGLIPFEFDQPPAWGAADNKFVISSVPEKGAMFPGKHTRTIDLDEFFVDPNDDKLTYLATSAPGLQVELSGSLLTFNPEKGIIGPRIITVVASDGKHITRKEIAVDIV
ncbi:hypothetical protein KY346_04350 [Candidatus Woesearchaeota archaeon]|nr:hypothetical protein [Candidatus Woesearchaeota archaeon]